MIRVSINFLYLEPMDRNVKPETLRKVSERLPPPALFRGPSFHNASNPSLQPPVPTVVAPRGSQPASTPLLHRRRSSPKPLDAPGLSPFLSRTQSRGEVDGSDTIWEEMQSALSDVEVSAAARGHVFGEMHSEALEDLRVKHLRLAQAWARGEGEDEVSDSKTATERPPSPRNDSVGETDDSAKNLDEETEKDIQLARERREANDRYFDRVNNSVLDVVAKLEDIAQAMRTMEAESKDIWSEDDSLSTATQSTVNTAG